MTTGRTGIGGISGAGRCPRRGARAAIVAIGAAFLIVAAAPMARAGESVPAAGGSVRPDECSAAYHAGLGGPGNPVARAPCGQQRRFEPFGLGSLVWTGPDWGVPARGEQA